MKSISTLTDFYYKTLHPKLQELEAQRKRVRFQVLLTSSFILLFGTILLSVLAKENLIGFEFLIFLGIASLGLISFIYKYLSKDYIQNFKDQIIKPLIHEIDPSLHYLKDNHISQYQFQASHLFSAPDRLRGNDHIRGTIDGVKIEFSDLHAQKKHKDSKGRTSWSTIFQGLYIISEFPKHFHGQTFILPDSAQKTFGSLLGNWLQSNNFMRGELVKMDDIAFEREFVVYSQDQIEARYLLSHSLMQKILELRRKSAHPLSIAFVGNHIYIAIEYGKDLFEPTFFSSLLDYKLAMEYIKTLNMTIGIVNELKLNEKLWSKQ
jgi:hypothetical protein